MQSGGRKVITSFSSAAAALGVLNIQRNHECEARQNFADTQFTHAITYTSMKHQVITPHQMAIFKEAQKEKWTQKEGVVLKLEDKLRNFNPFGVLGD